MKKRLSDEAYLTGILARDPVVLGKAITLFESNLPNDALLTNRLLEKLLPYAGKSLRIGISGVPGAGKSTFIEGMGKMLTSLNKKVAVLTIDPTSTISKGSILGDKTRMEKLAMDPLALIRTSPSNLYLGGVSLHTRKLIILCEAAGFDIIFIETVGTGQSESEVRSMTDFLILLVLTEGGDELQGMKKGLAELADLILVNKADGGNTEPAKIKKLELEQLLHLNQVGKYKTCIETISSIHPGGFQAIWDLIEVRMQELHASGAVEEERKKQGISWMHESIEHQLLQLFYAHPLVVKALKQLEPPVSTGKLSGISAAQQLIKIFKPDN